MSDFKQGPWRRFAEDRGGTFFYVGSRRFVELCAGVPVEVELSLDPAGPYFGWQYGGEDARYGEDDGCPTMIWPSEVQRDMCFTYGPEAAEATGRGRRVRLRLARC